MVSNAASNDRLIDVLAADLTPIRRLTSPLRRVLAWLALVAGLAVVLVMVHDPEPVVRRFAASFDLCASAIGSMLTAVLAGIAAFQLSLPDRKPGWALVPVPAIILWIGASTVHCLGPPPDVGDSPVALGGTDNCLIFILGVGVPLSILCIFMLRSGYSLRPNLTSIVCGLACSAAAATLLNFVHAHDVTAPDLAVHAFAVCVVTLTTRIFGSRFLTGKNFRPWRNESHAPRELTNTSTLQDWTNHVEDDVADNRPTHREPVRTNHQGHVIQLHRQGGDGS